MRDVAVVGAGELGGAVAHAVARLNVARRITLVDERGRVAEGKALDIAQAAPVEGFSTTLAGATDISAVAGADAIVIADRFGAGEWRDDEALVLLKQLGGAARRAIVVCAGASGAALVDRGVRELKLPRQRLFGTAPEALAAGVRALAALQINGSASDVALCVVGRPPADAVVSWNDATIGGQPLSSILDEPVRRRLDAKMKALWPPGPLALGAAAAAALAAIDGRSRRFATCFVGPDLSAGERTRAAALPVRLARSGIVEVVMPALSAGERVALENAMLL